MSARLRYTKGVRWINLCLGPRYVFVPHVCYQIVETISGLRSPPDAMSSFPQAVNDLCASSHIYRRVLILSDIMYRSVSSTKRTPIIDRRNSVIGNFTLLLNSRFLYTITKTDLIMSHVAGAAPFPWHNSCKFLIMLPPMGEYDSPHPVHKKNFIG